MNELTEHDKDQLVLEAMAFVGSALKDARYHTDGADWIYIADPPGDASRPIEAAVAHNGHIFDVTIHLDARHVEQIF